MTSEGGRGRREWSWNLRVGMVLEEGEPTESSAARRPGMGGLT